MCSYCGCENIEVIGRFMAEHVDLINASADLGLACESGDSTTIQVAARTLAELLHPHGGAEEVGLFTVLAEDPEFSEHVRELCGEHVDLDARLSAIITGEHTTYADFDRALRRHIDREENGVFPAAAIAFAGPEWQRVADLTPPPVRLPG